MPTRRRRPTQSKTKITTLTVKNKDRTSDILDPVNVRELVPRHREPEVERNPISAQQRALQYDPRHAPPLPRRPLRQVARRPAPERPPVQHYALRRQALGVDQVVVRGVDVLVDGRLGGGGGAHRLAVTAVVVRQKVDVQDAAQVGEPVVDHAEVLGVAVGEEDRHRRLGAGDVEGGDGDAVLGVQEEVTGGMQKSHGGGLEQQGRNQVAHSLAIGIGRGEGGSGGERWRWGGRQTETEIEKVWSDEPFRDRGQEEIRKPL